MALNDLVIFEEARRYKSTRGWSATDQIYLALITNATVPVPEAALPGLGVGATTRYTEVTAGATGYVAGGQLLDTWGNMLTEAAGTVTFDDTGTAVTWTQNANSPNDAYYAVIYNNTDADDLAIGYIDIGGPVDLSAGDLSITWNANGIYVIAPSP